MARSGIASLPAALGLALLAITSWATPAQASPDTCPVSGLDSIAVTVSSPEDGDRVDGVVTVRGKAVSEAGIFQVDLLVGDSLRNRLIVDPPSGSVDFALSWDAAAIPSDSAVDRVLTVVACGGEADQGRLSRGSDRVDVTVQPAAAPAPRTLEGTVPSRDADRPSRPWVGAVIIIPSLVGLAYALGARARAARKAASLSREAAQDSGSADP